MKITKRQLKRIIKEEKAKLLNEQFGFGGDSPSDPLIAFAKAYASLGTAVQEQVDALIKGWEAFEDLESDVDFEDVVYDQNPNALRMAIDKLKDLTYDLGLAGEKVRAPLDTAESILEDM
tara:strand:+ start:5078 stop:5437 length:360 start_codon:yes stop_codon:yes gene_type:complete